MGLLQQKLPSHVSKIYYPIDRRDYVTRALAVIKPEAIVLVEAELWPNFLWRARELKMPVFLVNARLSDRSYRGYKRFAFIFRPLFASLTAVGTQNEADAARMRDLGCQPDNVHVVGNLKFDTAKLDERRLLDVRGMLSQIGVPDNALLLVGGSTHPGEEAILAEIFLRLRPGQGDRVRPQYAEFHFNRRLVHCAGGRRSSPRRRALGADVRRIA
jgi:3-deoxy-D-manno-octulosonic-acid transferase